MILDVKDRVEKHYSNIYEILCDCGCDADFMNIPRFCRSEDKEFAVFSDYDRFASLCEAIPFYIGNDFAHIARIVLDVLFDCKLEINPENRDEIWRITSEKLVKGDVTIPQAKTDRRIFNIPDLSDGEKFKPFSSAITSPSPASFGNIIPTGTRTLVISRDCLESFVIPDLYHSKLILEKLRKDAILSSGEREMWQSEVCYLTAIAAREKKISLAVEASPSAFALVSFLLSKNTAPDTAIFVNSTDDIASFAELKKKYADAELCLGFSHTNNSASSLNLLLDSAAAVYPALCALGFGDFSGNIGGYIYSLFFKKIFEQKFGAKDHGEENFEKFIAT